MKIVYFYQYFSTPKGSWGTRVYEFAKRWVAEGHDVTVVTSIYYKSDMKASGIVSNQLIDGVNVKVLNIHVSNKQNFFQRIFSFLAYCILSIYYAISLPADIVIASSGPITAGIPGLFSKWVRGRKLVIEVRDLWPEGAIEMGLLKNKLFIKFSYFLERTLYKAADVIITLSPGMTDWIKSRYGFNNVYDIPNACDNDLFSEKTEKERILPDWTKSAPFAVYTGNIGEINNSRLLFDASVCLSTSLNGSNIKIVMIGDGPLREYFEREAKERNLKNFILIGLLPKDEVVAWVQGAICTLTPLVNKPVLDTSSPNKIFDSLAAGTPVIQTTKGWIKDFVEKYECGINVDADDASQVAEAIVYLSTNEGIQKKMGKNAKKVAVENFDRDILSKKMLNILLRMEDNGK